MKSILPAALFLLLAACAQIREPQGGPKDTAPPQLLSAEPADGSTNFTGNRIVLRFDEKVKLDRVREKLLVSPPLAKPPEVAVERGTNVVITLNAPLAANTTYTFNVGDAVQDLSEGNPAAGMAFVVSTGNHVDSLSVTGHVIGAATGLPAADVLVLLHAAADTGDVRTAPPDYFTRTRADGSFALTHLPGGPMRLYALIDRNGNYRYDLPNEQIAFLDGSINPEKAPKESLFLFQPVSATQFISAAKVLDERGWQLAFARRAGEVGLRSLDREGGKLEWWAEWNTGRDTAVFWPSDTTLLGGQRFVVSGQDGILDTLTYRPTTKMPFYLSVSALRDLETGQWQLISSRPVAHVDTAHVDLRLDSVRTSWVPVLDSSERRTIRTGIVPKPGMRVSMVLFPKAVQAVMGGTNDTTRLSFTAPDPRTLGKLKVELSVDSGSAYRGPWVLQLLTGKGNLVQENAMDSLAPVHWMDLAPGSYSLRLVADRNHDRRWTTGSFIPPLQPERVFVLQDPVKVRAGWTVETDWKVQEGQ
ncbi:MAG: Ig-like domain-containing protein [Bacteroidetes bacterium]|nr:Ig-like domain-containing protein [Bacteroidota bacterium]MBS1942003.1 Ig-like domain-containing protein [Bacteroidota bacterium]